MKTLQKMTVRDAYTLEMTPSLIAQPDEIFADVVRQFTERPELRGIFVVDEKQHLLGVITWRDLLDWARIQLGAGFRTTTSAWLAEDARLITIMRASTAGGILRPESSRAAVQLEDSLADALHLMIELDLICLPVVNEAGRIIGDLKLIEILSRVIQEEDDVGNMTV